MTGNAELMFNLGAPSQGHGWVRIGEGTAKKVLCVGTSNLEFHRNTDIGVQRSPLYVVNGVAINSFSPGHQLVVRRLWRGPQQAHKPPAGDPWEGRRRHFLCDICTNICAKTKQQGAF